MNRRPKARKHNAQKRKRTIHKKSLSFDKNCVRPLAGAENYFLEVLLEQYRIKRDGAGVELRVKFDGNSPALWGHSGRQHVQNRIRHLGRRAPGIQRRLDACLADGAAKIYEHNDPTFPFRYASGGTLPIVRRDRTDYYCLFYRDIYPVGWNIANGGCDSREELRNPLETAEREFREELLILDPVNQRRHVFGGDADAPVDWPEFSVARNLWASRLGLSLPDLSEQRVPLMWLDGPDRLVVDSGEVVPNVVRGCFVNINAKDFGIEIDRIARLSIDMDSVLMDGELHGRHLVNAPVGLFEVGRLARQMAKGLHHFIPDLLFHGGMCYDGSDTERIIKESFLPEVRPIRNDKHHAAYRNERHKLDLCPVTHAIIARHRWPVRTVQQDGRAYELFISFGGEDRQYAHEVYSFFREKYHTFFSEEAVHEANFLRQIDAALDQAACLIAVATRPERLRRQWVQWEMDRFQCDVLSGIKPKGQMLAFVAAGVPLGDLPGRLRVNQVFNFDPTKLNATLFKMAKFIPSLAR